MFPYLNVSTTQNIAAAQAKPRFDHGFTKSNTQQKTVKLGRGSVEGGSTSVVHESRLSQKSVARQY